jgi:hypothetical protein
MTRNRQLLRLVHLARPSKRNTMQAESPPHTRRRAFRRLGVGAALSAAALLVAQVVLAAPPQDVTITITPNNSPDVNQPRTFSASASDPDSDITGYEWDFEYCGTATCFSPDANEQTVQHSYSTAGLRNVAVRVTDGMTNDTTNDQVIQVQPVNVTPANQPPTAQVSCSPAEINQGDPVTCNSSSSLDDDGGIISYEWRVDGRAFSQAGPTFSPPSNLLTPGSHTITVRVTDTDGATATASDSVSVNAKPNAPPQAGFGVAPETAYVGDTVTLSSSSHDPDGAGDPLSFAWDLDNDGQFDDASAATVSKRFGSAGTYPLKLRVTDSKGATSTATGKVTVQSRPVPPLQVLPGVEVEARFLLFARNTNVKFLRVRAPAGSRVSVRCVGKKNCPKRLTKMSKGPKKLQFKKLQRMFRPRTKLIITVTKGGFIGKQMTYTMRRRKPPMKRTLCLPPGAKKANACPSG